MYVWTTHERGEIPTGPFRSNIQESSDVEHYLDHEQTSVSDRYRTGIRYRNVYIIMYRYSGRGKKYINKYI